MQFKVLDGTIVVNHASFDVCDKKLKPELVRCNLAGYGIPQRCNFNHSSTFCFKGYKLFTLSPATQKLFPFFSVSKAVAIRIEISHDTGTSCFESEARVVKKNGSS